MNFIKTFFCIILLCILVTADDSYAVERENTDIVTVTGTIRHQSFEGGFYGIVSDDGHIYKPLRLPASYQVEGVRVRVKAKKIRNVLGFHAWGTPVEIIDIQTVSRDESMSTERGH